MEKYITVNIPRKDENDEYIHWWAPQECSRTIIELERLCPEYDFHQFVTSPGHGVNGEFAIMKIKSK